MANPVDIGSVFTASSASTITLTTTGAVPAGTRILLAVSWFNNGITISSISDGTYTYTVDKVQNTASTNSHAAVASVLATSGLASGSTITVNLSGASLSRGLCAAYTDSHTGAAYGAVGQQQNSNTAWTSTTTTVNNGDLLWGCSHWEDSVTVTNTPSGGNTELHDLTNAGSGFTTCYQVGTGAAIAASGTWSATSSAGDGTVNIAVAYTAGGPQTFPTVATTNETAVSTAGTSHAINLPASIAAGDLLLICTNVGSTAATFNALAGWTEVVDEGVANGITIWARKADGTEGATVTFTSSASTRSASIAYRITGAIDPATQLPELSTVATGSSVSPNATTCTPTGGSKNYLWISLFGRAGEEADDDTWTSAAPTGYSNLLQKACGIAGTNLGGMIATAQKQATAASEDAGAFTCATGAWRAYTVAVHPAPPAAVLPPRATIILQAVTRSNNW